MDCNFGAAAGHQMAQGMMYMGALPGGLHPGAREGDALLGEGASGWAAQFGQHGGVHPGVPMMGMMPNRNNVAMAEAAQMQEMEALFAQTHHQQQQQQQLLQQNELAMMQRTQHHSMNRTGEALMPLPMTGGMIHAPMALNHMMGLGMMPLVGPLVHPMSMSTAATDLQATVGPQAVKESAAAASAVADPVWDQIKKFDAEKFNIDDSPQFVVEGEAPQSVSEKNSASEFYGFMSRIGKKELVIDEEKGVVVDGPGPEPETMEDMQYLREEILREGFDTDALDGGLAGQAVPSAPVHVDPLQQLSGAEERLREGVQYRWGSDEESGEDDFMKHDHGVLDPEMEAENWAQEYAELQERLDRARSHAEYPFEPNNPYMFHDDPFAEGMDMLALGNLAEAVLAFEAVCQKEPERQEGWRMLGTTQAGNEKDQLAILALVQAHKLAPKDLTVLSALAVSHTNESHGLKALEALQSWLLAHPEYEHLGSVDLRGGEDHAESTEYDGEFLFIPKAEFIDCLTLYSAAIQMNPDDVDLHSHLGVLHSLSRNFDAAAESFRTAVALRPDDAKLWNKLGATLANGNKSEEALTAYNRALDINPGYVRVMYNMGIAHANLQQHHQCAKYLLRAICMQQGGSTPEEGMPRSTREMWDVLRMALNLLGKSELVQLTWKQDVTPFLTEFGLEELL